MKILSKFFRFFYPFSFDFCIKIGVKNCNPEKSIV